jgi:hypothetical protein
MATLEQVSDAIALALRSVGYATIEQRLDFGETEELAAELAPYVASELGLVES